MLIHQHPKNIQTYWKNNGCHTFFVRLRTLPRPATQWTATTPVSALEWHFKGIVFSYQYSPYVWMVGHIHNTHAIYTKIIKNTSTHLVPVYTFLFYTSVGYNAFPFFQMTTGVTEWNSGPPCRVLWPVSLANEAVPFENQILKFQALPKQTVSQGPIFVRTDLMRSVVSTGSDTFFWSPEKCWKTSPREEQRHPEKSFRGPDGFLTACWTRQMMINYKCSKTHLNVPKPTWIFWDIYIQKHLLWRRVTVNVPAPGALMPTFSKSSGEYVGSQVRTWWTWRRTRPVIEWLGSKKIRHLWLLY